MHQLLIFQPLSSLVHPIEVWVWIQISRTGFGPPMPLVDPRQTSPSSVVVSRLGGQAHVSTVARFFGVSCPAGFERGGRSSSRLPHKPVTDASSVRHVLAQGRDRERSCRNARPPTCCSVLRRFEVLAPLPGSIFWPLDLIKCGGLGLIDRFVKAGGRSIDFASPNQNRANKVSMIRKANQATTTRDSTHLVAYASASLLLSVPFLHGVWADPTHS